MGKRILVADDEPGYVLLLEAMLQKRGHTVLKASNGADAVKIAIAEVPDLVIMDVLMPGMDGPEAAALLKENEKTKNIPIFFLTGIINSEEENNAPGVSRVLAKPVSYNDLLAAIREIETS